MDKIFTFDEINTLLGGRLVLHENGECWAYDGPKYRDGYGTYKGVPVHRIALAHKLGHPIPKGIMSLHSCDIKNCARPDHLRPGTHADNMADKVKNPKWAETRAFLSAKLKGIARDWRSHPNYKRAALLRASDPILKAKQSAAQKARWANLKKVVRNHYEIEVLTDTEFKPTSFYFQSIEEARQFCKTHPNGEMFRIIQVVTTRRITK